MKETVETELRPWAALTIRGFGLAHIIFALVGIYLTGEAQIRFAQTPTLSRAGPYRFETFYAMVVIDFLCNPVLLYTASFLLRLINSVGDLRAVCTRMTLTVAIPLS